MPPANSGARIPSAAYRDLPPNASRFDYVYRVQVAVRDNATGRFMKPIFRMVGSDTPLTYAQVQEAILVPDEAAGTPPEPETFTRLGGFAVDATARR